MREMEKKESRPLVRFPRFSLFEIYLEFGF